MRQEIFNAELYELKARFVSDGGVFNTRGVKLRQKRDSKRGNHYNRHTEKPIVKSAVLFVFNINVCKTHQKQKRAEQKSAARAGHYHCNVHKHRADKIQVAAADKDAYHGYDHEENACDKVALLEKQHSAFLYKFIQVLNIKSKDHDNEQKSSGVQDSGNALDAVIAALILEPRSEDQIEHKLTEAETESVVKPNRLKVIICGYYSDTSDDKRRRNGNIGICELAENDFSAVINKVKQKREGKRHYRIPHVLRKHGKILVVRH